MFASIIPHQPLQDWAGRIVNIVISQTRKLRPREVPRQPVFKRNFQNNPAVA
jgi:hypothetical protein